MSLAEKGQGRVLAQSIESDGNAAEALSPSVSHAATTRRLLQKADPICHAGPW